MHTSKTGAHPVRGSYATWITSCDYISIVIVIVIYVVTRSSSSSSSSSSSDSNSITPLSRLADDVTLAVFAIKRVIVKPMTTSVAKKSIAWRQCTAICKWCRFTGWRIHHVQLLRFFCGALPYEAHYAYSISRLLTVSWRFVTQKRKVLESSNLVERNNAVACVIGDDI